MEKHRSDLKSLWLNTHPIDSWILEHISFFRNEWGQKIMVGSCLITIHADSGLPDIIRYDRSPGYVSNDGAQAIFAIQYFCDYCRFILSMERGSQEFTDENSQKLDYADPRFFDQLDALIWNTRSVDYIISDLQAIITNIGIIKQGILDKPTNVIKQSGMIRRILEETGRWDKLVQKRTISFCEHGELPRSGPKNSLGFDGEDAYLDTGYHDDDEEGPAF